MRHFTASSPDFHGHCDANVISAPPMHRLIPVFGLFVFLLLAWALSTNRRRFPFRTVLGGLLLQFVCAMLILWTSPGRAFFVGAQNSISLLNRYAMEGASMVFGPLATTEKLDTAFGPGSAIFAVIVAATIIFVSSLSALLYHWGILQRIVRGMAAVMQWVMGTSGSESLAAATNVFLGQTEAALLVKPYLPQMTRSEIMALMATGMATIASGVMAVYASLGIDGGHLLTASVLSAPAGLLVAKIMLPETEESPTRKGAKAVVERLAENSTDAACRGASDGVQLALNVIGMLIAFVALVSLANALLMGLQSMCQIQNPVNFQTIFGWINAPFAWLMGVPAKDCAFVGQVLGERVVLNEFVGYLTLAKSAPAGFDPRSTTIATYALCGFANFASIAIQVGGIGAMVPERRKDLAAFGMRSMVGGILACYITACIVAILTP